MDTDERTGPLGQETEPAATDTWTCAYCWQTAPPPCPNPACPSRADTPIWNQLNEEARPVRNHGPGTATDNPKETTSEPAQA